MWPRRSCSSLAWLGLLVSAVVLSGCSRSSAQGETMSGPEASDLVEHVAGFVVKAGRDAQTQDTYGIFGITLPRAREFLIRGRPESLGLSGFEAVSGPDQTCRVAYTELGSAAARRPVSLKTVRLDGQEDRTIFTRDARRALGDHVALAPRGGLVAVIAATENRQMPGALLSRGVLEVWNVVTGTRERTGPTALDEPMAWFPDGERLAYVDLVPRARPDAGPSPAVSERFSRWAEVPAVHVFDVTAGQSRLLAFGRGLAISPDGRRVLLDGLDGYGKLVDVESGQQTRVRWPGRARSETIALVAPDLVLFRGLPTRGTEPRFAKYGSFRAGTPLATLKVSRLDGAAFQTVVPYIDWRHSISHGVCDPAANGIALRP